MRVMRVMVMMMAVGSTRAYTHSLCVSFVSPFPVSNDEIGRW